MPDEALAVRGTAAGSARSVTCIHARRGRIGLVGPPGSASQEVAARIHDFTGGMSTFVATSSAATTTIREIDAIVAGVDALQSDAASTVVVVVAPRPTPMAAATLIEKLAGARIPAIACVVGADEATIALGTSRDVPVYTRSKTAALAAVTADGVDPESLDLHPLNEPLIAEVRAMLAPEQRYIRGLFTAGGLRAEAIALAREFHPDVREGAPDAGVGTPAHVFWDLGASAADDRHPKTDARARSRLLRATSADPAVGVVVLDFVLGAGADDDPVGAMLPAIRAAKGAAADRGRHLEVLGYVLGTDADPQGLAAQTAMLQDAGVTWASSATNTGLLARAFVAAR
ncbi:hypothetical protein GH740_06860 [Microbacterium sp. SYP-A9085]|uniref:hypothetical protein n=1 Tax=Microbacterium sp. SYP-A9085 TaxID=2664454 RepID=UPI00129A10FF|nr:hypothetical protein [Microbacterium sp. SYP-A9085]MRH29036.1 hypothetical protein [Microbacterium sp. SYP-A9085]